MVGARFIKVLRAQAGNMTLDVDFTIQPRSFITLYGKSGAGKTSILRMLAGLMDPDEGYLSVDDDCWYDSSNHIDLGTFCSNR